MPNSFCNATYPLSCNLTDCRECAVLEIQVLGCKNVLYPQIPYWPMSCGWHGWARRSRARTSKYCTKLLFLTWRLLITALVLKLDMLLRTAYLGDQSSILEEYLVPSSSILTKVYDIDSVDSPGRAQRERGGDPKSLAIRKCILH